MMDMEMNADLDKDGASDVEELSSGGSSVGSVYCTLEQDFARITKEMKTNPDLAVYEAEYARLFESLYKSQQHEQELDRKCDNLDEKLTVTRERINDLEAKLSSKALIMTDLEAKLDEARSIADSSHGREQRAQQVVENLRLSVAKLTNELESRNRQLAIDENDDDNNGDSNNKRIVKTTGDNNSGLAKERERLANELDTMKMRLKSVTAMRLELEAKLNEAEQKVVEMQDSLDRQTNELAKEKRERDRAESDLQALHQELEMRMTELQAAENTIGTMTRNAERQDKLLRDQIYTNERLQREARKLAAKQDTMRIENGKLMQRYEKTLKELGDKSIVLKDLGRELQATKDESSKYKTERDVTAKKLAKETNLRNRSDESSKRCAASLRKAELEIAALNRQIETEKRAAEKLNREKDQLAKSNVGLDDVNKKLTTDVRLFEQSNRKLESGLEEATDEANQLRRIVKSLEKERDRCNSEVQEMVQKIEDSAEQVKLSRNETSECQKKLAELEGKMRQQLAVFEDVRAERNSYKKSLNQCQAEIADFKARVKDLVAQSTQLGERLAVREAEIAKNEFLWNKSEKEKEGLRSALSNGRRTVQELRQTIEKYRDDERKLRTNLQETEQKLLTTRKDLDCAMNERDVIGAQMVRRNDELSLQYGKLRVMGDALGRGGDDYAKREREIRALKLENGKLKFDKTALEKTAGNNVELRGQIFQLERQLAQERLKVSALEEELETPINVHRWRNLEGSDPETYELLRKIQLLQKRIFKISVELVDKERRLKDTEKLYLDLRDTMAKQPGPEVLVRLGKTRRALRERGKKMKCLVAELNMALTSEHKFEIDRLKKELGQVRAKCLAQRRKQQMMQQQLNAKEAAPRVDKNTVNDEAMVNVEQLDSTINVDKEPDSTTPA